MRYLYIAGACGSIGTQTLDIVRENKNEFKVIGMSVGKNKELAIKLIEEFKPEIVCFREGYAYDLSYNPKIVFGDSGLLELASYSKYPDEVFVNALVGMSKIKAINIAEAISEYDDKFINSITLKDITSYSEFRDLIKTLERANHIVTEYYMMLYNDYMMYINNDGNLNTSIDLETVKHYKSLAQRIQSIYNYVNFIFTFENPYKIRKNK